MMWLLLAGLAHADPDPPEAPVPTEAPVPAEAPEPAEPEAPAPTEAPVPTEAPEPVPEAPVPTEAPEPVPAETPHPTPAPDPAPAPTPAPASEPSGLDYFNLFPEPAPEPNVVVVSPQGQPLPGLLDPILPHPPNRGLRSALPLGVLALLFVGLAMLFRRLSTPLRSSGLLPQGLRTSEIVFRLLAAVFGIGALGALVPQSLAPALPVVVLAIAVAIGWSARDVLQDLVAGVFLGVEGQLRAGHWVRGERYSGTVEAIGLRVTWLRDVYGRRIVVPNRVLLAQPLVADDNPWPRIQFTVAMPLHAAPNAVRSALEEAIVVSPWVAPDPDVEVHPDGIEPGHWHIAVRLLDSRYADRFQGLLRERVEEILPE